MLDIGGAFVVMGLIVIFTIIDNWMGRHVARRGPVRLGPKADIDPARRLQAASLGGRLPPFPKRIGRIVVTAAVAEEHEGHQTASNEK
jgi:hypothetical protein